jgi:hypothetical protein
MCPYCVEGERVLALLEGECIAVSGKDDEQEAEVSKQRNVLLGI